MFALSRDRDRSIIDRYTNQPSRLPPDARACIEAAWGGAPVELYAFVDLDEDLQLAPAWLALGPSHLALCRLEEGTWRAKLVSRDAIAEVRESAGASCRVVTFAQEGDVEPLLVVRFTHRQQRSIDLVRFALEETMHGRRLEPGPSDDAYAHAVAGPIREAQAMVAKSEAAVVVRLIGYLRPYRWHLVLGMSAAALITVLSLVPAYLAGYLVDEVVEPLRSGQAVQEGLAWLAVGAIAASYALRAGASWVRLRFMSVLGEYVARDLRTQLYAHLQRLGLAFFSRKKTGSLITRVSSDTDRLWEFLAFGVVDVSLSIVMLLGLGAVLVSLDWRLGLVMTLPVPFLCGFILVHGQRMETYFLRAWRKWSRVTDVLSDTIPGIRVVKAFNQEGHERARFDARNESAANEFNAIHGVWTAFWPVLMLGIHSLTVAVWVLAIPRLLGTSEPTLSAGTFVSFLLYTTMFVAPIEVIGQMARVMNRATSSAHRIFEVLDTEPEVVDRPDPIRLEPVEGRVTFERVTFHYDGSRPVLKGLSFDVRPGEMIGLVGPSGGGKTTITNLIARFYDPTGGVVKIDGVDLRDLDSGHFRRQLGIVLQDPYLFHGTIVDNIRYGRPEATLEQVVAAAKAANAHDFVCKLPHGYDSIVGERGHTLSGGERQRISIARAILHDPRILILDEATSSVDTDTERKIEEAMHRLVAGRTCIAIAHRLSTLRRADRLFVIEDGQITEQGTHESLLAHPEGTYRRLVDMQSELRAAV